MSYSFGKYIVNVREEKDAQILEHCQKIYDDLYISKETKDLILYDFKLKKKILNINFHIYQITSIHICKKPLIIDNQEFTFTKNSFFILTSSLDRKIALHHIFYIDNSFNYKLIAGCKPSRDEINNIIQIENGQILVATRDQTVILFSNNIIDGKFQKLYEIIKDWPMDASKLFHIKNNLIGVFWTYDDAEADETFDEETGEINHAGDGIIIYSIDNNEIIEKKILKRKEVYGKNFLVLTKDKFILNYTIKDYMELGVYDLNNLEFLFKIKLDYIQRIYPFNKKNFISFHREGDKAIFNIYNINTMKNVQNFEIKNDINTDEFFSPINENEYVFRNSIIAIYEKK